MSDTLTSKFRPGETVLAPVEGGTWHGQVIDDRGHKYCATCHCQPMNPDHRLDGSLCCPGPWYRIQLSEPGGGALPDRQTYAEHELTRPMNLQQAYQDLIASYGWTQLLALARTVTDAYNILDGTAARGATLRMVPKHEGPCHACPETIVGYEVDVRPGVCTCSDTTRPTKNAPCRETEVYGLCVGCGVRLRELLHLYT